MAALTAATTRRESAGSLTLMRYTFTTASDGDTFASGLPNVWGFWCHGDNNPSTQASAGISATESSGTFTFRPGEDSLALTLFVLTKT